MTLYLLNFNNYFNRKIVKYDNIDNYVSDSQANSRLASEPINNFQYQPTDEVNLKVVLNRKINEIGNYFLVCDGIDIIARYFVIECKRNALGQYEVACRRDIVSDFYTDVLDATSYIEKATLNDGNPLVFNKEDLNVSQIKKEEILLNDSSNTAWIVGYIARNFPSTDQTISINVPEANPEITEEEFIAKYKKYFDNSYKRLTDFYNMSNDVVMQSGFGISFNSSNPAGPYGGTRLNLFCNLNGYYLSNQNTVNPNYNKRFYYDAEGQYIPSIVANKLFAHMPYAMTDIKKYIRSSLGYISSEEEKELDYIKGKVVKYNGNLYTIDVEVVSNYIDSYRPVDGDALTNVIVNALDTEDFGGTPTSDNIDITCAYKTCKIVLRTYARNFELVLPADRFHLYDAPYDMFAIPFSDTLQVDGTYGVEDYSFICSKKIALAIVQELADNDSVYDVQIVPYSPCDNEFIMGETGIMLPKDNAKTTHILSQGLPSMIMFWCGNSSFSKTINKSIEVEDYKLDNETRTYRLTSPNYNGVFEFSPAMNAGVEYYDVDCTYKPYMPYIHIAPHFKYMYGQDFDDARGLICNGNFSITRIKDNFEQYELQNKNYQNIFNREIQSLKIHQTYERLQQGIGIGGSALMAGVASGIYTANPFVGIGVGLGSAGAGVGDYLMSEGLRKEQLNYKQDMYNFSLDNIRALPYSLSNVTAYNENNKLFPFIEVYECSDIEKDAMISKLKWNGMKVGVIGKIKDYILDYETYIKAQLIRIEGNHDYHLTSEIYEELNKGIFIGGTE